MRRTGAGGEWMEHVLFLKVQSTSKSEKEMDEGAKGGIMWYMLVQCVNKLFYICTKAYFKSELNDLKPNWL
jgi:hypothetical protein